jgi:PIN domain nuclease of toxin-antitoxin system
MERIAHLDTHAVVWLYAKQLDLFPRRSLDLIRQSTLEISPAVALELQYLMEVGKITDSSETILSALEKEIGLRFSSAKFGDVARCAVKNGWTRDPFDRLITATADLNHVKLITKDQTIRRHYRWAVWD